MEPPNSGTDFLLVPYTCSGLVVLFHLQTTKTVVNGEFFPVKIEDYPFAEVQTAHPVHR